MTLNKETLKIFKLLGEYDTPTVCNALELLDPNYRNQGYTKKEFFCLNKSLPPIIGFVRTAKIFSNIRKKAMNLNQKLKYYRYMADEKLPKICIIEDTNINPVGCFWGEVQANIHKNLGFKGIITNGAIRDINDIPNNFQMLSRSVLPSHSYLQLLNIGKTVKVNGQKFKHNDIVHADHHGVVRIDPQYLKQLPLAIKHIVKNEKPILDLCKSKKFTLKKLEKILTIKQDHH
ncbi:MAG: hypothetical protein CL851_03065 [Crocinitomicaceae bacterium]|nr:hypothetical protein [Crocinitomicaceae bacterium]